MDRESEAIEIGNNEFEEKCVSESLIVFHCNESLFLVMYNSGTYIRARNFNGLSQARFLLLYPRKKQQAVTRSRMYVTQMIIRMAITNMTIIKIKVIKAGCGLTSH